VADEGREPLAAADVCSFVDMMMTAAALRSRIVGEGGEEEVSLPVG
jgi:hypothetical protein